MHACLQAQCRAGGALTKAAFRKAKVVFDSVHDVDAVLRWFERAVASSMADTDVYCDAIESCIDSRKYKVGSSALQQRTNASVHPCSHFVKTCCSSVIHVVTATSSIKDRTLARTCS